MPRIIWVAAAIYAITLATAVPGRAQPPVPESTGPVSYELRAQLFIASYRWSHFEDSDYGTRGADGSLYFSPGLGLRIVSRAGHALLLDGDYRFDVDFDGVISEASFPIRFGVGHVGYAYRYVAGYRRRAKTIRIWTITPHASLAAGAARKFTYKSGNIPTRSPVVGARVGVDFDVHVQRFFLGWSFAYEFLHHTRGALTRSNFFSWSVLPVFRLGMNFGRPVAREGWPSPP